MNNIQKRRKLITGTSIFLVLFFGLTVNAFTQNFTTFKGIVKDSATQELLPYVTVQFEGTTIGVFSGEDGSFSLRSSRNHTQIVVSFMGYKTQKFTIPVGKVTEKEILLESQDRALGEVVIRPDKQKYSKKNNPAVDLIKKVIKNKNRNNISSKDYYQCQEYEQMLLGLNEFKPNKGQFKKFKFLPNYVVTSAIDNKPILPFSVRETISDFYYRKDPKTEKYKVKAYDLSGIDKALDIEGLDDVVNELFKNMSIYDNTITLLFQNFVSPLSEHRAVNFFRWYITDTVEVDNKSYIHLDFIPFNTLDLGFTGHLLISNDSIYAVKKAVLKAPTKTNMNYVDELIIQHDFQEIAPNQWAPLRQQMAIDLSYYNTMKLYVEKNRIFDEYVTDQPQDSIYANEKNKIYDPGYNRKPKEYWIENRPESHQVDYRMDEMVDDVMEIDVFKYSMKFGKLLADGGYFRTRKDEAKNKIDLGTLMTAYSYNSIEGNRLRLTAKTTSNFHPKLYLYGYGAYGTKDGRFKYYGEASWAFNKKEKHKDEFPKNNLTFGYKYDMNSLGERFMQNERDNILMSLRSSKNAKLTYNRQSLLSWEHESYNGFSFIISAKTFDERAAGKLIFERLDDFNNKSERSSIRTSEGSVSLRYAPKEKFMQYQRARYDISTQGYVVSLTHTAALKGVLGGQFDYNRVSFASESRFWIPQFGKITVNLQAERLWGEAPFPLLLSPSANTSFTIQKGNFYLLEPLEFLHDQQITWSINYSMGGLIFNRIPFLKKFRLREVFGFRGVWGDLSDRNDPMINHELLLFPDNSFKANREPYMEYNIGIENILSIIRIDYVRRINYLNNPDVSKDGIKISFRFSF